MKHEDDGDTNGNSLEKPGKEIGWTSDQRKNRDHPDYSTAKIS